MNTKREVVGPGPPVVGWVDVAGTVTVGPGAAASSGSVGTEATEFWGADADPRDAGVDSTDEVGSASDRGIDCDVDDEGGDEPVGAPSADVNGVEESVGD